MVRFVALLLGMAVLTCAGGLQGGEPAGKVYDVQLVPEGTITVDGKLGESEWPAGGWMDDFTFPWRTRKTPRTEMCCACDGKRLLFAFRCGDSDLVLRGAVPEDEMAVAAGDRVELFFTKDLAIEEYYCFEMSPAGNVLDYRASFYREFDRSWDCPELVLSAATDGDGYVVEGSIPLATLKTLCGADFLKGQPLRVGAFRAEYSHVDGEEPEEAWISWILPKSETPDFHIPSSFGTFRLKE